MAEDLSVENEVSHPVTRGAARAIARAWRQTGGGAIRLGRLNGHSSGPQIKLTLGSLVRPSVVVHFEVPYRTDRAAAADRLALTTAAWDSLGDFEVWRALSAPATTIPRLGRPDWSRPWVVTLGRGRGRSDHQAETRAQLHSIGGWRRPPSGVVWWPCWSGAVAAVLGRAECVLGDRGPLVYDAIRAGVPLQSSNGQSSNGQPSNGQPSNGQSSNDLSSNGSAAEPSMGFGGALAGLIPPSLAGDPRTWRHVVQTARTVHETGRSPSPLMTPQWVQLGRERIRKYLAAPPGAWEHLRRCHDKLKRDPRRFFGDSRFAPLRGFGRVMLPRS